jgi:hypothetical protein
MAETIQPLDAAPLVRIEPRDRLVVLARTLQANGPAADAELADQAAAGERFGQACLGQALYRHRAVFRSASDAPVWSHLELSYFQDVVPAAAIEALVAQRQSPEIRLLRAEILLTSPSTFMLPHGWQGSAGRPEWQASLEYIDVQPAHLGDYREIMRTYIGTAATRLMQAGGIGTFRAMETAAVLYQDPALKTGWNQIHLCEVQAEGFQGFGEAFGAAIREASPDGAFATVFAGLDRMRTVPRWTFNDAVVEKDTALERLRTAAS